MDGGVGAWVSEWDEWKDEWMGGRGVDTWVNE